MRLFEPPPPTRFDLCFTLFRVPVRVHPLFWLIAALFGGITGDLRTLIIWVASVFLSVLVHKMGHAPAMRRFGVGHR